VLRQHRSTQRKAPRGRDDEEALTADIVTLASQFGRYGYRRVAALLRAAGWQVNRKRVERIWRAEGLKDPARQPKRGRLWLGDGSCLRLRPERPNHVWSYDFVQDRTHDGRRIRMLTVIDEHTRECLALPVARRLNSDDVLAVLADLFVERGPPEHIRSDNGTEFTATAVREWLGRLGVKTAFIEPGSPWENGYNESFNGKLRDELLDREVFYTLAEARVLIGAWRRHYNTVRPHSALGYRPPAPEAVAPPSRAAPWTPSGSAALRLPPAMAQGPTMPQHSKRTTRWGPARHGRGDRHALHPRANVGRDGGDDPERFLFVDGDRELRPAQALPLQTYDEVALRDEPRCGRTGLRCHTHHPERYRRGDRRHHARTLRGVPSVALSAMAAEDAVRPRAPDRRSGMGRRT
jgi:transposase InsO family protein